MKNALSGPAAPTIVAAQKMDQTMQTSPKRKMVFPGLADARLLRVGKLAGLITGALAACQAGLAGPPLLTDDPGTPGPNHWEINLALTAEQDARLWGFETPLLDLNYGVGDHLQLKYEAPWVESEPPNAGLRSGAGESLVGVKWRFLDQEKVGVDVSTYPQYLFNNFSSSVKRGLVDPDQFFLLPFEVQRQFGDLVVYGEAGYYFSQPRSDQWLYGMAAEYEINKKFSIMGELHSYGPDGFGDDELVSNLGFGWKFQEHVSLIGSAGRSLRDSSRGGGIANVLGYLALQITL
jgi:hypothetical protein